MKTAQEVMKELDSYLDRKPVNESHRQYLLGSIHTLYWVLINEKIVKDNLTYDVQAIYAEKIEQWEKDN